MKIHTSGALLLAVTLAATGCSSFSRRPSPAVHDFGPLQTGAARRETASPTVVVEAPEWLRDQRIRYRLIYADPTQVRFYADDHWLAPPPALLAQRLLAAGEGQPYRLRVQLTDFEQIFDARDRSRIVLSFHATALTSDNGRMVGERVFTFSRPTPTPDAAGAVTAFATAVNQAAGEVGAWLATLAAPP